MNLVIRILVISFIKQIGFNQESQIIAEIVTCIFVSTYINTGIMILLTNGHFEFKFLETING